MLYEVPQDDGKDRPANARTGRHTRQGEPQPLAEPVRDYARPEGEDGAASDLCPNGGVYCISETQARYDSDGDRGWEWKK